MKICPKCNYENPDNARFCERCGAEISAPVPPVSPATDPPRPDAPTPEPLRTAPAAPVEYAGFWLRFVAIIIDGILLGAVNWTVSFSLSEHTFISFGPGIIIGWLYFALMESSQYQGTLGKLALNIKVTDIYGRRVSFARATGRHFGKYISTVILMIGYMMAGFSEKKQALHDMLADCLVVKR